MSDNPTTGGDAKCHAACADNTIKPESASAQYNAAPTVQPVGAADNPTSGNPLGLPDPMTWHGDNPTSGEWTLHQWKDKESYDVKCGDKVICGDLLKFEANMIINAHNAALAAAYEKGMKGGIKATGIALEEQLAAEMEKSELFSETIQELRDKVQTLRDALAKFEGRHGWTDQDAALAKVEDKKL